MPAEARPWFFPVRVGTEGRSPHLSVPLFPQRDARAHLRSEVISLFILCSSDIKNCSWRQVKT